MGGSRTKRRARLTMVWRVACVACRRIIETAEDPRVIRCKVCDQVMKWTRIHPRVEQPKTPPRYPPEQYIEYINSPEWKRKRAEKYKQAGRTCVDCGSHTFLSVHHKNYKRLGREFLSDLEVLCRTCHEGRHSVCGMDEWLWRT